MVTKTSRLSHWTRLFIFLLVIISTELGSNVGLYLATAMWLEERWILRVERSILEYLNKVNKG